MQKNDKFLMGLLSPREKEIFLLKDKGMSERQIASKLGIKRGAVRIHFSRIEKKWATPIDQINEKYDIIKTKRKIK